MRVKINAQWRMFDLQEIGQYLEARFFYFLYINTMDAKLTKVYYSPQGFEKKLLP